MTKTILVELIFRGKFNLSKLSFMIELLKNTREIRFNFPEIETQLNYKEIVDVFDLNDYVDFVITTDNLNISGQQVKNVFINIGLNEEVLEFFFFFDLKDLNKTSDKMSLDFLRIWCNEIIGKYLFDKVICKIDNGNELEYFFDERGFGPLYPK
jgi:hypothetical protein